MTKEERAQEIKGRISKELNFYHGKLPDEVKLVWDGYLAALLEWGLIGVEHDRELLEMLPHIPKSPTYSISTGEPGAHLKLNNEEEKSQNKKI
jgi:hypothetical protein